MSFLADSPPRVIAHRGFHRDHAENTLGAFQAALEVGADLLETDVHLSKDGHVIVAHDPDLRRVAGINASLSDFTAAELGKIDLGHGEGFPTLTQLLEKFPEAKFNIDLKTPDAVEPFVDVVRGLDAHHRVLATSFDETTRQRVVNLLPDVVSSASQDMVIKARIRSWFAMPLETWAVGPEIVALQIPPTRYGVALVTPSMLKFAHRKGLEVHVWTINDPRQMRRLWDMGVDGIVTDRSDLAVQVRDEIFFEKK